MATPYPRFDAISEQQLMTIFNDTFSLLVQGINQCLNTVLTTALQCHEKIETAVLHELKNRANLGRQTNETSLSKNSIYNGSKDNIQKEKKLGKSK